MALLDQLTNPARANIPGALQQRNQLLLQKNQLQDQQRQGQARDLAGQVLGETFAGKLGELAGIAPDKALQLAQILGIPPDSKGRFNNMIGVVVQADKLIEKGLIQEAAQFLNEQATNIERFEGPGSAEKLRSAQQALIQGNTEVINNFRRFAQAVTPEGKAPEAFTLSPGQTRFRGSEAIASVGAAPRSGRDILAQVQSSQILPDGSTVQVFKDGSTRVTGPQGRVLKGQERQDAVEDAQEFGIDVQSRRAGGRTGATQTEQRAGALITRGIAAAESTATIRRAIDLLDRVKTGGMAAISLATMQRLGIEGADEGELSNSLGKSVLSQLRETFGAAFTENEGERLIRIEAGFGKSTESNRRLLGQALRIAERTANRAIKAAKKRGNMAEIADIQDLLTFTLDLPEAQQGAAGLVDNGDGTFTLPDGRIVRRTGG